MLYISGERLENLKQILTKKYTLEAKGQLLFKELDNVSHCSHRNKLSESDHDIYQ